LAGAQAVLAEFASGAEVAACYAEALRRRDAGVLPADLEIVPAARTVLFDGFERLDDQARFARELPQWRSPPVAAGEHQVRPIPTRYDGPDLPEIARHWQLSPAQAVQRHASLEFVVAFLGFAPGFAYLEGLPRDLRLPRRDRPRTRVPAGAVGLADEYTGIYPRSSPGGWQLIGHTATPIWDETREPAAYLLPGDRVRFVPIR
jgi:KipI family sensor histidine kinase inhibitor